MDIKKNTETTEFTVQGVTLVAPKPFTEGHPLTATEAAVLNQTFVENIRNNFAKAVKTAQEEVGEGNEPDLKALQAELDEYIAGYEFGVRRSSGGGRVVDPVEKKAREIARKLVTQAIKDQGHKISDFDAETKNGYIDGLLADADRGAKIRKQAKDQLEAERKLAKDSITLDIAA